MQAPINLLPEGRNSRVESDELTAACVANGAAFLSPSHKAIRLQKDRPTCNIAAHGAGMQLLTASESLPHESKEAQEVARLIGYPLLIKARSPNKEHELHVVDNEDELSLYCEMAMRNAILMFGTGDLYLQKFVRSV